MKRVITDYTINVGASTITFNEFTASNPLEKERLLIINNGTLQTVVYNFSNTKQLVTQTNYNTLFFSTPSLSSIANFFGTFMSNSDELLIYYDNGLSGASNEVLDALYEISTRLEFLAAVRGISADLRVTPLSTPNMSTLSNLSALGGWSANTEVKNWDNLTAINSNINNVG
jgi:hypothetical protein